MTETTWPTCKCGCGSNVQRDRHYRAGHDARHVSILFSAVRDGQLRLRSAQARLKHSPTLRDKLTARVQRHRQARAA